MFRTFGLGLILAWLTGWSATAQDIPLSSPILTLDQERLFEGSGVSARVSSEVERLTQELADENRRIEAELVAEELELTEKRAELDPETFREMADAFDVLPCSIMLHVASSGPTRSTTPWAALLQAVH